MAIRFIFIKITEMAAAAPMLIGLIIVHPQTLPLLGIEFGLFFAGYVALFLSCNKDPLTVGLKGQESPWISGPNHPGMKEGLCRLIRQ